MAIHPRSAIVLAFGIACGSAAAQPCGPAQDLGILPNGMFSWATGASHDGSVVVGWANIDGSVGQDLRAFRWTQSGGMQSIPTLGGNRSYAHAVSADGAVVVGEAYDAAGVPRAFRWTAAGGIQNLGTGPGRINSVARAVSADGSVVVGEVLDSSLIYHSFRWTAATGMVYLPNTQSTAGSRATSVSADGETIVCEVRVEDGNDDVIIWDANLGTFNLTLWAGLNRGLWIATGAGITADGNTVIGQEWSGTAIRSYLWSLPNFQETLINNPAGLEQNRAFAVSASGGVVVGAAVNVSTLAFVWTPAGQMTFPTPAQGFSTAFATTVSGDGRYVAGWSGNTTVAGQFRATRWACGTTPVCLADFNASGAVTVQDIFDFLTAYFNASPTADINASGTLTVQDIFDFLAAYFAGC